MWATTEQIGHKVWKSLMAMLCMDYVNQTPVARQRSLDTPSIGIQYVTAISIEMNEQFYE